ncbi:DUF6157 family protein [Paenibacillus sp. LHD-117]|uniref:DUF6157 family protein n=1 Tax=Paenibacillus sp. LHD-117 TaxID=3071412 RepID=UPI0027DF1E60|nr:DUF6157 family protein [Paenibacillus sp. LHD-117]MDQ6420835.1 DUF6157 family protein [Paenibacillus sp. LHD-117]
MQRHWCNMFVRVASDCPVELGVIPVQKRQDKPSHVIQYELLSEHPYRYTFEEQLFEVYIRHKGLLDTLDEEELAAARKELLDRNHPCMRASQLTKKFGWGFHFNEEGRIALYGMETEQYGAFVEAGEASELELQNAIRSSRIKQATIGKGKE